MIPSSVLVKLNGLTIGLSCRFEDADNCDNVGAVGDVPNLVENVVGSHANEHMEVDTNLNDHANLNLGSNDPQSVIENDSVGLVDIHVAHSIELAQVAESSKSSSGFRDGSLDPKKIIEAPEASEYRPKEHVGTLVEILASSKCVDVPDSNKSGEARLTIEVCNSLGLFFDAMIWRYDSSIIDDHFIMSNGRFICMNLDCALVNVYAPIDSNDRGMGFQKLSKCLSSLGIPILMRGDFNIVRCLEEKFGDSLNRRDMDQFSDFIDYLNLMNFAFTWRQFYMVQSSGSSDFLHAR
ncbi:hypothetical protein V6N13_123102 [Hibiscus sabdariffa]